MNYATLSEVCDIVVGRTPPRKDPSMWGEGEPWLSIADMNQGLAIRRTKEQITRSAAASGRPVLPGTVLLSFKLSIGKVAISEIPLYTNEAIAALPIKDKAVLDERFLLRFLESAELTSGSNRAAMGATLNKSKLQNIQVPLPPLEEQRRIAAILDQADAIRSKRRQQIKRLGDLRLSVFQHMFGRRGADIKDLEVHKLGAIIKFKSGKFLPNKKQLGGPYCVYGGNGVNGQHSEYLFEEPKVVIGRVGAYCGVVHLTAPKSWVTDNALYVSEMSQNLSLQYLSDALRAANLNQYASRSGQPLISANRIKDVLIGVPSQSVQKIYDSRVNKIRIQESFMGVSLNRDDELFASLQDRAFRGEL